MEKKVLKVFFMHIPKCGGKGIVNIFEKLGCKVNRICNDDCKNSKCSPNTPNDHKIVLKGGYDKRCVCQRAVSKETHGVVNCLVHHFFPREKKSGDVIFASIRNPYELMVSRYHYHCKFYPGSYTFEEWVELYSDETMVRFIESCYDNADVTKDFIVDHFIKLEDVYGSVKSLIESGKLDSLGIGPISDDELKALCGVKVNKTKHKDFNEYYNDYTREKVYKSCEPIFKMFGYKK